MVPMSKNISIVKPKTEHSLVCVWPCKVLSCCCDTFQIISRCDVALLQEVRDIKEQALPKLVKSINRWLTRENWVDAWSHQCSSTQLSVMTTPHMETYSSLNSCVHFCISGMTLDMSTRLWPVRDWAGLTHTRSSMYLFTGERMCSHYCATFLPTQTFLELIFLSECVQDWHGESHWRVSVPR